MCTAPKREHDFEGFGGAKFDKKSMQKRVQKWMRKMSAKKCEIPKKQSPIWGSFWVKNAKIIEKITPKFMHDF